MTRACVAFLLAAVFALTAADDNAQDVFLVKPYLQLGDFAASSHSDKLVLLWHTRDVDAAFEINVRVTPASKWARADSPSFERVVVRGVEPHRVWSAGMKGLSPGTEFDYQVTLAGKRLFEARARARKSAGQQHRFAVFGDCGQNSPEQKAIAFQTWKAEPDFVFITGDIVYSRGRIPEYREKHFPVYSAEPPSPSAGAPLLQSTLFIGAPGNHDIATVDLEEYPDTQAYFFYWRQPLNGPASFRPAAHTGPEPDVQALLAAAGSRYPRMANFSFDYGDAHWTVIDSNPYVDWNSSDLQQWLSEDLKNAANAKWRFVGFHHPGFNSSKAHFNEQQTRVLAPLFEQHDVDIVFSGHVHNYQRSFPMKFVPAPGLDGKIPARGVVNGSWTLDKAFGTATTTKPDGVIYIVTGAGGARLYNPEQQDDRASWQEFTSTFVSKVHSVSVVDLNGSQLTFRQIDTAGNSVDSFTIIKR